MKRKDGKQSKPRKLCLPDGKRLVRQFKKIRAMECPCCGGRMDLHETVWSCRNCAYCITQEDMLQGYVFWFCDECGRFMNVQPGFTQKTGVWKCISCGYLNDVSGENMVE